VEISEVQFAKSGDVHIAYQRYGTGPNVVIIPPLVSNVELGWEQEIFRRVREHIGRYVHVLEFDKRGIGSSDRFEQHPTLTERIGDIHAVMAAAGVERASLLGLSEGGLMAQLFAAMHPERVDRLVLVNSAFGLSAVEHLQAYGHNDDPVYGVDEALGRLWHMVETWGREPEVMVDVVCPSQNGNAAFTRWIARYQRQTASPADIKRQLESVIGLDANAELPNIKAATLVANVKGDRVVHPAVGRYLADKIPGARFVEFAGEDHFCWIMPNWRELMDCWIEFVTGVAPDAHTERRFATVLFTDIVGSTAQSARVGDTTWRGMLESHDRIAWKVVDQRRGKLVKNTGDGLLVTFDSPSEAIAATSTLTQELAGVGLTIRAGLHAGEVEVREDGDVVGLAVNLAARVQQAARDDSTYVSSTLRDLLLGGGWSFEDRGEHTLKGIDGAWRLYELTGVGGRRGNG
jgi:class 3 adenylate cyclase/pimeloyl-ACP methyl ester carboxylesterase